MTKTDENQENTKACFSCLHVPPLLFTYSAHLLLVLVSRRVKLRQSTYARHCRAHSASMASAGMPASVALISRVRIWKISKCFRLSRNSWIGTLKLYLQNSRPTADKRRSRRFRLLRGTCRGPACGALGGCGEVNRTKTTTHSVGVRPLATYRGPPAQ